MASTLKSLSTFSNKNLSGVADRKFAIVVAEWNSEVTERLYNGAYSTLLHAGVREENIIRKDVPGSFELSLGAQYMAQWKDIDAVICLGCVIKGETPHFDFICQAVAHGITEVGLKYNKPVVFGVITTLNLEQALDRAGGKHGNKGDEAAATAIKMLNF
ncbi:6,7-dimethyl-8-ribityllumazine synthase [Rhodoflexus caldus]|jgi:6,7-dimethyl-8-ribityllumazine synthase|uniref:6,7-dimethyl-8-ribityllumazine synthase n=1 Tax=Rhodoflexus caldus TaxID=2891236 RepID=UPI00202A97DF|nr:6,7-dimethyl-8-ribityllumazine synthase [Rhodoflexus caldus]